MRVEPKFKKGDYVTNRNAGDLAIIKGVTKKNYYQFEAYYGAMFRELKNLKDYNYDLQVDYQKFWDYCTDEEKQKLDEIIQKKGEM